MIYRYFAKSQITSLDLEKSKGENLPLADQLHQNRLSKGPCGPAQHGLVRATVSHTAALVVLYYTSVTPAPSISTSNNQIHYMPVTL